MKLFKSPFRFSSSKYMEVLDLQSSPFNPCTNERELYADPEQAKNLDLLQHLLQYSEEVLFLSGKKGSGKTTLLKQFIQHMDAQWQICHINCSKTVTAKRLLQQIADDFKLTSVQGGQTTLESLQCQLREISAEQPALLVVDNAEKLTDDALEVLLHLTQLPIERGKLLRLIIAGDTELKERFRSERFSTLSKLHRIELEGMGEAHSAAYVMQRLSAAGFNGDAPFTVPELKGLHERSQGFPGVLNKEAHSLLARKYTESPWQGKGWRFVQAGIIITTVVTALLGVEEVRTAEENAAQLSNVNTSEKPVLVPVVSAPTYLATKDATLIIQDHGVQEKPIYTAGLIKVAASDNSAAGEAPRLKATEPAEIVGQNKTIRLILRGSGFRPGSKVALSRDGKVKVLQQDLVEYVDPTRLVIAVNPGVKKSNWAIQVSTPDNRLSNVLRFAVSSASVPEEKPDTTETAVANNQIPAVTQPALIEKPVVKPVQVKPAVVSSGKGNGTTELLGADWLAAQPGSNYTLQLMAAQSRSNIEGYVRKHKMPEPLAYFKSHDKKGNTLHILTHGSFPDKGTANIAVKTLPKGLKPWLRSMASVQQVMIKEAPATAEKAHAETSGAVPPDTAWIWSQDPVRYTIQLAASVDEAAVNATKQGLSLPGELAVVQALRNGKPWYVLVYGSFPSKESAHGTISRLPASLKRSGPWVRSFANIQDEVSGSTPHQ